MVNIKDAAVAVRSNLLTIVILVRIKLVVMDSTPSANAAAIRRNELGQKWIILLKEKYAHSVIKKRILMIFIKDEIR